MRAKDEFKFIAEAYDTKLLLERIVDGTLMCPEACCGSPVMECKCGPDCPHCNCHEIQKLTKEEDAEGALGNLVKGVGRGVGDIATGVGRVGLAAGGAGAAAAGGALGAALKIAKTLTADQLQKLGEYALKKSSEDNEVFVDKPLIWHHDNYSRLKQKAMRGEELTDQEYDDLKWSEGELDRHGELQR